MISARMKPPLQIGVDLPRSFLGDCVPANLPRPDLVFSDGEEGDLIDDVV